MSEQKAQDIINKFISETPELRKMFEIHEPKYRYWKYKNRYFCYTVEKTEHKGKQRYVAFIRKELISRRTKTSRFLKMVKKVGFAKRKLAKARAYEWYEKYKLKKENGFSEIVPNNSTKKGVSKNEK